MQSVLAKRLFLHVGPHKTGSTYLQKRLTDAKGALRERGIEYPEFGVSLVGHHPIVDTFRWGGPATRIDKTAIREALAQFNQLIISSENFVFLDRERLVAFRDLFADYDIIPIFYIRNIADIWPSHWQEFVKHGADETFLEYMATVEGWLNCFDLSPIDQSHQMEKLADVFGFHKLIAISYDNVLASGESIFDQFWRDVLKLADHGLPAYNRSINPSLGPERVEVIRTLNQLFREREHRAPGPSLRKGYQQQVKLIEASPEFELFCTEFKSRAITMKISRSHPAVLRTDEMLMAKFGPRIINRHSDHALLPAYSGDRSFLCAQRDWIFRSVVRDFVENLYRKLAATGNDGAPAA
jgi:hypothetical protein